MNRTEVRDLLTYIEGFERRPFPPTAVDAWLTLLATVDQADAMQAVTEHFDSPEAQQAVQPGQIKRRANTIRENRERAERRALPAPSRYRPPNPEYQRARQLLAERLGDLSRVVPSRPPARADATAPTAPDSGVTEDARRRALASLRAYRSAA